MKRGAEEVSTTTKRTTTTDSSPKLSAIILIGGPTGATQFRPLSLDIPKPLFPIAGKPMIYHHIAACAAVHGLQEIFLLGDFPKEVFGQFIDDTSREFKIKITFLQEEKPLGTAGGLFQFKEQITNGGERDFIFLLHSDICCTFPLQQLFEFHKERSHKFSATMMGTKVDKQAAPTYGCYVADDSHKMLHYAEHPESFISDTVNAGVYIFSPQALSKPTLRTHTKSDLCSYLGSGSSREQEIGDVVSMEIDIIPSLVDQSKIAVYEYTGFWRSIKNAGGAVYANEQYMHWYAKTNPSLLTQSKDVKFEVIGGVIVHPTAQVDPTSKIGPNVYIGPNVKIGSGARVHNTIILDNVSVQERACVTYTIIGEESSVGAWTRIEGLPSATAALLEGRDARFRRQGITVFGKGVTAGAEIIIRNCIVMPHKAIKTSVFNEIIL